MDGPESFKNFLGPAGNGYTDAQLQQLRREMYAMAELLLDIFLWKKSQGRQQSAADSPSGERPQIFDKVKHPS